jgi:hypothetical protein
LPKGHAFDRRSFAVENVDREPCVLQNRLVFLVEPVLPASKSKSRRVVEHSNRSHLRNRPNSGGEMIFWTKGEQLPALSCRDFNRFGASVTAWPAGQFDGFASFSE